MDANVSKLSQMAGRRALLLLTATTRWAHLRLRSCVYLRLNSTQYETS
jgi:hypothetical protein